MSDSETDPCRTVDLPDLVSLVQTRWRMIAAVAFGFLIVAVIGTTVKQPVYESTAFLEVSDESEIATVEEKLRFPSLYQSITETEAAARDLAQRTRVRGRRGSRLISVTVKHSEPSTAAMEANAVIEAFLSNKLTAIEDQAAEFQRDLVAGLYDRMAAIDALPGPEAADSPEVLAATWRNQKAELENLSEKYQGEHQAVTGARQRLEKLEDRIRKHFVELREKLGLPQGGFDRASFENQLDMMVAETIALRKSRVSLKERLGQLEPQSVKSEEEAGRMPYQFAELATPPSEPTGIRRPIVWLGALILGAFLGFLGVLCRRGY